MGDFKKLKIWHKAHDLTIKKYELTKKLPKDEDYGLKSQIRRAAVSCESNIAEGETRFTDADKIRFFVDARSSSAEVTTQLMIIRDVYLDLAEEVNILIEEYESFSKQTNSLISYRKNNPIAQKPKSLTV